MAESMLSRLRRRMTRPRQEVGTQLPPPRRYIELGLVWPWLALIIIVVVHPGWTSGQISELLAVFTPYIMLATPPRGGRGC